MIGRNWDIALAVCLSFMVAGVDNLSNELPEPENFILSRNPDHFSVTAEWSEPTSLDDCKVNYTLDLIFEKCPPSSTEPKLSEESRQTVHLKYTWYVSNEREICVWVRTNPVQCGNRTPSKAVYKGISPPLALVKNFTCVYYSDMKMNCTWSVISQVPDLQLFYRNEEGDHLKPCSSYFTKEDMKIGCHLDKINFTSQQTFFIITGTVKGSRISNTFKRAPRDSVKPEPPKLSITRDGNHLYLQSDTPNFAPQCWKYKFTYSKCNEEKQVVVEAEKKPSLLLEYDAACRYEAQVQTIFTDYCGKVTQSDPSGYEFYGESTDLNSQFKVAMIVFPLMVSCCLIVALVLFRRYKDIILPTIPEPSLLFKDMLNSNNDGGQSKSLYVPITEVVERDVRLEPKPTSLHLKP
ncbi:granulocyte-macrophage colony-stimulating factor receptor subunit alpha-like [Colossoma macropomum]|uniref:granulocyte-macrophage colony-stimulating factor receptor subunit alpha-like n=1 Tax=Colossoma macropomum TaxID=42526 RepID=UPI0018647CB6|nr:granulocyte-macrophage colony-stimulating factor receptor subunit alpha-like [Colossoma macropomum]